MIIKLSGYTMQHWIEKDTWIHSPTPVDGNKAQIFAEAHFGFS